MTYVILAIALIGGALMTVWWFGIGKHIPPTGEVVINGQSFAVEIAGTPELRERGLSGHAPLAENEGMLFLFERPANQQFWMKGMEFSIDMIWIRDGRVVAITENATPESFKKLQLFSAGEPVTEVLEVNAGIAQKFGIKKGDAAVIKK